MLKYILKYFLNRTNNNFNWVISLLLGRKIYCIKKENYP